MKPHKKTARIASTKGIQLSMKTTPPLTLFLLCLTSLLFYSCNVQESLNTKTHVAKTMVNENSPPIHEQEPGGTQTNTQLDWCLEHQLPESKCTKCNPKLIPFFQSKGDFCKAHGFPESVCPVCHPQKPLAEMEQVDLESRTVRFGSPHLEQVAGIKTETVERSPSTEEVSCTARIAFNADQVEEIRAIVPGVIKRVRVKLGERVKPGTPLFDLQSTRIADIQGAHQTAQEHLRATRANLKRKQGLREKGIASARQVEIAQQEVAKAQSEVRTTKANLRLAGAAKATPSGRYTLSSSMLGTVVQRPAVVGLLATQNVSLATIVDTSSMWALCEIPENHASRIELGQTLTVFVGQENTSSFRGKLDWIASEVHPQTRTVTARAELSNPEGKLRANQFARARIQVLTSEPILQVPRSAIQRIEEREIVFIRTAPSVFEPRVVKQQGSGRKELIPVTGRIQSGDQVVTTGSVLLLTEIMPGSIGAGCGDHGTAGGH